MQVQAYVDLQVRREETLFYFISFYFILLFLSFRAAPATFGSSQAKGGIRAAGAGLQHSHSNVGSEPHLDLHHSSWQCWILNPRSEARDQTQPSWMLAGFVTAKPQRELQEIF